MIIRRGVDASRSVEDREAFHHHLRSSLPPAAVVLATCDRVEVYEGEGEPQPETVRHLFRVVSGLESPLLGEHQIQGQVKRAYRDASERGPLAPGLHRLFQQALRVGKRVRTETRLGDGATGHAQVAADLLGKLPVPLSELRILFIGVNHLNRGILKYLTDRGHQAFFLGNRSLERAIDLVTELGSGQALSLDHLPEVLSRVDAVVSATSAPHLIVHDHHLPHHGGPRWFFDLAVPRDIDPTIALRPGVTLYNVSDLEAVAQASLRERRSEALRAGLIIEQELSRFFLGRAEAVG